MKKQLNFIKTKCKSLSRQLSRSSSYSQSSKSSSSREEIDQQEEWHYQTVWVGQSKRRYAISSKYLNHPLLNAVIGKENGNGDLWVNCEVVFFDHLLWMLEDGEFDVQTADTLQELVEFYAM